MTPALGRGPAAAPDLPTMTLHRCRSSIWESWKQWAAVSTHWSEMRDPRHVSLLLGCREQTTVRVCCYPALLTSGIQAPPLPLDTLKVTCQGVLSWLEALADMFPTPQMVSVSLETSVDEDRWGGGG